MQISRLIRAAALLLAGALGFLGSSSLAFATAETREPVMVAMGDSYSSGEGACTPQTARNCAYIAGSDTPVDRCHRSTRAWPYLAGQSLLAAGTIRGFEFVACSGSRIQDLYQPNHRYPLDGPGSQFDRLRAISSDPARYVKAVTLTIGGNDQDFSGVIVSCILRGTPCVRKHQKVPDAEFVRRLRVAYRDIHRAAPEAHLFVLGYPHLFPNPAFAWRCDMPPVAAAWIRDRIDHIDTLIGRAVRQVDTHMSSRFASFVSTAHAFDGHELCRERRDRRVSYVNGLLPLPPVRPESFHPDIPGQQALFRALRGSLGVLPH